MLDIFIEYVVDCIYILMLRKRSFVSSVIPDNVILLPPGCVLSYPY